MPYITYLTNPEQHTNQAYSHPGWGETREESQRNARYHANQMPWVRTVAASRAPRWAQRAAWTTQRNKLEGIANYGEFLDTPRKLTAEEEKELEGYRVQEIYG